MFVQNKRARVDVKSKARHRGAVALSLATFATNGSIKEKVTEGIGNRV